MSTSEHRHVPRDIVVIGTSAGGLDALRRVLSMIPADIQAAFFIVQHVPETSTSMLPQILARACALPVAHAIDGELVTNGRVYVAPPGRHLMIHDGVVETVHGPRENRSRPAVDPLFRSAAYWYGTRVIGVILTGSLDDGTSGLMTIKRCGGIAVVQDPDDAEFSGMPSSALQYVPVDFCLPIDAIGPAIVDLITSATIDGSDPMRPSENGAANDVTEYEIRIDEMSMEALGGDGRPGTSSPFACPECGGVLWEMPGDELMRFRCRVGHAFTAQHLLASQTEGMEAALWSALRALEEKVSLAQRLRQRSSERGQSAAAARFEEQEQSADTAARVIRDLLLGAGRQYDLTQSNRELEARSADD